VLEKKKAGKRQNGAVARVSLRVSVDVGVCVWLSLCFYCGLLVCVCVRLRLLLCVSADVCI